MKQFIYFMLMIFFAVVLLIAVVIKSPLNTQLIIAIALGFSFMGYEVCDYER